MRRGSGRGTGRARWLPSLVRRYARYVMMYIYIYIYTHTYICILIIIQAHAHYLMHMYYTYIDIDMHARIYIQHNDNVLLFGPYRDSAGPEKLIAGPNLYARGSLHRVRDLKPCRFSPSRKGGAEGDTKHATLKRPSKVC